MSIVLVDGGLHLLEDLIDGGQVLTSLSVAHWGETVGLDGICLIVATADSDGLIGRDTKAGRNDLRKLKTLKLEETAADALVVDRIELAALDLTEELIESIIPALASFEVIGSLGSRCAVVCHWTVAWVLACLHGSGQHEGR